MIFSPFHNKCENRPAALNRPVFMILIVVFVLFQGLASSFHPVQAESYAGPTTVTPTPEINITIPGSGEPVILQPGNNARLISPLKLKVTAQPGEDGLIRIEMLGHDNRAIFRKLMDYSAYQGKTLLIEQEIPFEIRSDESARLQVVIENTKGKTIFLTSVDLTLLLVKGTETSGEKPVNPRLKIEQPIPGTSITGETLTLKGGFKPINDTPLLIEVLASDWHTLTSRIIPINIPADQTAFAAFEAKLSYKTKTDIPATIRIRQDSNNLIKGPVFLWSEKIILVP